MSGVLGVEELLERIRSLPGSVVLKIMDRWTLDQAQVVARDARKAAPRDAKTPRTKPETARLWRSIRASKVKKGLKKFPGSVARAIAYGASVRGIHGSRYRAARRAAMAKGSARRTKAPMFGPVAPRARHFHLVNLGTKQRVQRTTGRRTGTMPANPFFGRVISHAMAAGLSDARTTLAVSYSKAVDSHFARMAKRMLK